VDDLKLQKDAEETTANGQIVTRKRHIVPRGHNQVQFVDNMRNLDINFGVGPAGTGKTYLAVACAVEALESGKVSRILLVRPAVEVGEKLGFLPGDLAQKIDPYLRPLYDALYEMLGAQRVLKCIEKNEIEIAPLAYMRGRTLNNAFIILDEGQNTTISQMKMFLTRIGFGSTVAVTGDLTQIDILLVRPAVEVGEKLGFLPGDLAQKIDPYLRPLYDALYEMLGAQRVLKCIEKNEIEIAPLAYMRGRTLNNAFIILDEGQNTTISQMKMFLTRIGFGSTVAVTGDLTQIDLPQHQYRQQSGLVHVLKIIKEIEGISIVHFNRRDVVRHPLVQDIVNAYERDDVHRQRKKDEPSE